jgi:spoIIIJ-associated protein
MIKEFEGKTEKEAIDKAVKELGLERDCFDVEIVETQRGGLFKKGYVKIRVHTSDPGRSHQPKQIKRQSRQKSGEYHGDGNHAREDKEADGEEQDAVVDEELEKALTGYIDRITALMGVDGKASVIFREKRKLGLNIASSDSSFVIGRKGKTLDALQLLASVYAVRLGREDIRIIIDCENYRLRREESLVRLAYSTAERARESRSSVLLEPMNPFDRRLIHTTLNDIGDIETKSEGQGMYKQVRVFYKGARR